MADQAGSPEGFSLSERFDAPREVVFAAWTDPDQVARWWAPEGLEIPRDSVVVEPRVGGRFELTMVDPDGTRYPLQSEFVELVEPELIVLSSEPIADAGIPERTITRVEFEVDGEGTRMTVTAGPYSDEMRGQAHAGWVSLFENLKELLAD